MGKSGSDRQNPSMPIKLEPPNLNIALERKEYFGARLVVAIALAAVAMSLVDPAFALVFAASAIVGLPVVLVVFIPHSTTSRLTSFNNASRLLSLALLLGYAALAKLVLVPMLIEAMRWAWAWL